MMAVSVLEMLKAVEARFGREGQEVGARAPGGVGYRLAMLRSFPEPPRGVWHCPGRGPPGEMSCPEAAYGANP